MSLPGDARAAIRYAMEMLPTWKRQECRDTVITARQNGLTVKECAAAAGCSPRHAKRILAAAGMAGMGRADAMQKAPAPKHDAAPVLAPPAAPSPASIAKLHADYREHVQSREPSRLDKVAAATAQPTPAPDVPGGQYQEIPDGRGGVIRRLMCWARSWNSKTGFSLEDDGAPTRSSDGQPADRRGTRGEGTVNAGVKSMDARNAILGGHPMTMADFYKAAGVTLSILEYETRDEQNARAIDEAFGVKGSGREAVSRGNLPTLGQWVRERNAAPAANVIKVRRPTHAFIGKHPDGSTFEF